MKIRIVRRDLTAAVDWAARRLDAKPTVPVRAGLLLTADGDQLTVAGVGDGGTTCSVLEAEVMEPGRIVVAGRLLASVLATYTGDLVEIVDGEQATVRCGNSEFRFSLLEPRDYPTPAAAPTVSGTVDGALFADAVRQVASATDPAWAAEPWRGGIQLIGGRDRLELWATDRYRLAQRFIPWTPSGGPAEAFIPADALVEAAKAMAGGDIELALHDTTAGISGSGQQLTVRTIDPRGRQDVRKFIPAADDCVTVADIEIGPLVASIKRACLVAGDRKPKVLLGVREDSVSVRAAGDDTGSVSLDSVPAALVTGIPMQIAFQPALLLQGLQSLTGDQVRLHLTQPHKPALLTEPSDEPDYRHLAMPVRL